MKIALITDGIWPYVLGGMQKHSYYLCKYLAQNKIKVDLFHFNQSEYKIDELEFFTSEEKKYIHPVVVDFPNSISFPGHYLYRSYKHSKLIFKAIQPSLNSYDFIYTKGFTGWYLINQKYFNRLDAPPIGVKFHGYEMFQKAPDLKTKIQHLLFLRAPVRAISKRADLVFSYGGKVTDIILSIGVNKNKIVELPSGVEKSVLCDKATSLHLPLRFLFLGRYERRKGVEELNVALLDLLNSNLRDKFEMHFVGPVPADKKVKAKNIIYYGEIRDKELLKQKIQNCDVLICPSWSEGFPNVIVEAMANGLTVIASNTGAINVLVNDENGILIQDSEPVLIENAMTQFISADKNFIQDKKQKALDTIKNDFTWEKLIGELLQKILQKIGGKT